MPRVKQKKLGRNDPCWCGSGRKYKDCHLPIEEAQRTEQRQLAEAQDTLVPKIMDAASSVPAALPAALEQFWQGKYTLEQMDDLDDLEERGAERFLVWFAFDHQLDDGHTLVEQLQAAAEAGNFEVDDHEARLLREWTSTRLRPYQVQAVHKGEGVELRDLLEQGYYHVRDRAASRRLDEGDVMVGHLVRVGNDPAPPPTAPTAGTPEAPAELPPGTPVYYIVGAIALLTEDTAEKVVEVADLHLADLRQEQPDATYSTLLRQRSHVLNHFVMQLPEEHTPGLLEDIVNRTRVALYASGIGSMPRTEEPDDTPQPPEHDTAPPTN